MLSKKKKRRKGAELLFMIWKLIKLKIGKTYKKSVAIFQIVSSLNLNGLTSFFAREHTGY